MDPCEGALGILNVRQEHERAAGEEDGSIANWERKALHLLLVQIYP
jgi:hypothetical protein